MSDSILVTDFDGTITSHDFFELVVSRFPRRNGTDHWRDYLDGRITHFEAMRRIYAAIRCSEPELLELVEAAEPDPDLAGAAARLRRRGWELVVVSAGCNWYIDRIFGAAGIRPELHTNPSRFSPESGLSMELPRGSRFFSPTHGIDKEAVVRNALGRARRVAFAGNGQPDLEAAMLVEPDLRFARGWLANELERRGVPFRRFGRWAQVAERLTA